MQCNYTSIRSPLILSDCKLGKPRASKVFSVFHFCRSDFLSSQTSFHFFNLIIIFCSGMGTTMGLPYSTMTLTNVTIMSVSLCVIIFLMCPAFKHVLYIVSGIRCKYIQGLGTLTASQHNILTITKTNVILVLLTGFKPWPFAAAIQRSITELLRHPTSCDILCKLFNAEFQKFA